MIADSDYGSEENYAYCEQADTKAFIKYNTLDVEQTKVWKNEIGRVENMTYEEDCDEWICTNGKRLTLQRETKRQLDNGYMWVKRIYRCSDCQGCPFQVSCAKGNERKTITIFLGNRKQ
ncbi:transposase [Ectobacillus funiculus]